MSGLVRKMQRLNYTPKRAWSRGAFMGRATQERRDGDLLTYYHPTKGWRTRTWSRLYKSRVDKRDMWSIVVHNISKLFKKKPDATP